VRSTLSGNKLIRKLKLKHSALSQGLILNHLPDERKYDYLMSSFRSVVEPYEDFGEMYLEEIIRRLDIVHFNNWFDEKFHEQVTKTDSKRSQF